MFDHNKLDEYIKAMELLGVDRVWIDETHGLKIGIGDNFQFEYRFVEINNMVYPCNVDPKFVYKSSDLEDFKKEVADYFLNK